MTNRVEANVTTHVSQNSLPGVPVGYTAAVGGAADHRHGNGVDGVFQPEGGRGLEIADVVGEGRSGHARQHAGGITGGMFPNVTHVLGWATMATILFCSLFLTCLSYFQIKDVYEGVLLAKMISLVALAAFGQSEALNFYLKHHSAATVSLVSLLNKIGIALTFICVFTLAVKLLMLKTVIEPERATGGLASMLLLMEHHSEVLAFLPIIYFSVIDALMWWGVEGRPEIGRICFVIADLPILMPISIIFILTVVLKVYGTHEFHLLIGGATVMFILVSIFLNECTRSLLYGFSPTSSPRRNQNHMNEEMSR
jgi:hypothetical protein